MFYFSKIGPDRPEDTTTAFGKCEGFRGGAVKQERTVPTKTTEIRKTCQEGPGTRR